MPTSSQNSPNPQRKPSPAVEIRDTGQYGRGVFALENIAKGTVIHVLGGETISLNDFVQRVNSGTENPNDPLQVGMRTYIDCDDLSRSFNHSCDPNAGLRKRSELFALRPILKGEQITFDYSATIAPTLWKMSCHCGSENCRKIIGDVRSIPHAQLAKYKRLGAIQRYMKTLFGKPRWHEIPKFEMEALNAMIKTSNED
jgi:SET domain-containing protein